MDYSALLNEEQLKPVTDTEGAVLVLAGAGSGKTRVLTYRVAYLMDVMKVSPNEILAITFTNKAAKEMQERIAAVTGQGGIWISTFHSLCARILRYDIDKLGGYNSRFTIYSDQDSGNLIARILKDMDIDVKEKRSYASYISNAKNGGLSPEEFYRRASFSNADLVYEVYKRYENELIASNALDFDDLMIKTVKLFAENPEVLSRWQDRFKYIHVDEFQDTNSIQMLLVRMLSHKYGNIFAVGDDDQSIYGWRGAEVENILNFKRFYPLCKIYKLQRNYRSTQNILDCANRIISKNTKRMGKELWTDVGAGSKVTYKHCYDDKAEADYVLTEIKGLINYNHYKPSDIAILVRVNSITRTFEEKMNMYGISYKVYGGFKFYERKEVLDLIAYLRLAANAKDSEAFLRIINFPKRGLGDTSISKLTDYAKASGKSPFEALEHIEDAGIFNQATKSKFIQFRELMKYIIEESAEKKIDELINLIIDCAGIKKAYNPDVIEDMNRLENIDEYVSSIIEYVKANPGAKLDDYLQSVALISSADDESGDCVTIATIHAVKGLEYACVFMVGCEDGIIPPVSANDSPDKLEEERRCMYVAVTRAKERLYLTSAGSRFRFGKYENNRVSKFIQDAGLVEEAKKAESKSKPIFGDLSALLSKKASAVPQPAVQQKLDKDLSGFVEGAKVRHQRYGEGVIKSMDGINAVIEFGKLGVREFNLRLAPIEVVK